MPRCIAWESSGLVEPTRSEGTKGEIASREVPFPVYKLNDTAYKSEQTQLPGKLPWTDIRKI
jgi:hypothetical protein